MSTSVANHKLALAVSVTFTGRGSRLAVNLDDGRTIVVPVEWYPRLQHGSPSERRRWRLIGVGDGIRWPDLDEDISVEGLLSGRRSMESPRSFARWLERRAAGLPHP